MVNHRADLLGDRPEVLIDSDDVCVCGEQGRVADTRGER